MLFPHPSLLAPQAWEHSYAAITQELEHDSVYLEAHMAKGRKSLKSPRRLNALQAFWPALQVLAGRVNAAARSFDPLFAIWRRYRALPEVYDLKHQGPLSFGRDSPLRPGAMSDARHSPSPHPVLAL